MSKCLIELTQFQTTDATPVTKTLFRISESSGLFEVRVVGRATDGTSGMWKFEPGVKHTGGEGISIIGDKDKKEKKESGSSSWDADLATDTDTIIAIIQGGNGVTITWRIMVSLFKFE